MTILFVSGVNDQARIGTTLDDKGNLVNLLDGNCSIQYRIPLKDGIGTNLLLFGRGVKQKGFSLQWAPSLIFNQIADPDTHKGALERCWQLCSQVNSPVINRPETIMKTTRDRVSDLLHGIPGVTMPRTIRFNPESPDEIFDRAESEDFGWPFIIRVAGDHGGKSMTRVTCPEDRPALHAYPFDGRDFYLTEYVDCKNEAGFYHRERLIVINGEPVLRGSLYDQDWMVHGASRSFMLTQESWEEEYARAATLENEVIPRAEPAIREITKRLGLELYGIDCSLNPDGTMIVFEANANMNFMTNSHPQMNERMDMIKDRLHALLVRYSGEQVI
jgi:glutathione synthase/RimK-type ligase-like ATP-grasp enzyme